MSVLGEYSGPEVKNAWSSAPIPLYVFSAWHFNKYSNILSLIYVLIQLLRV